MHVILAGTGCGTTRTMTEEVRETIRRAGIVIGSERLIRQLQEAEAGAGKSAAGPDAGSARPRAAGAAGRFVSATAAEDIMAALTSSRCEECCVVFSGDSGFYSGARRLIPLLREQGAEWSLLPGISSVQVLAARLGRPWQDWNLVSLHGADCDIASELMKGRPVFMLTGGSRGPAGICSRLTAAGFGSTSVIIGENLTSETERITTGKAADFSGAAFSQLSVMLAEPPDQAEKRSPGLPDEEFVRGEIPMTKQEVRAVIMAKLAVRPGDVCWDIGAGTGSVSVEFSRQARQVWAVEQKDEACDLILKNRVKFGAFNLNVVQGRAPEVLSRLPAPDVVFVGGSTGAMYDIIRAAAGASHSVRICATAIAIETLGQAVSSMTEAGLEPEAVLISVSRAVKAGQLHMMKAHNPVWIVSGARP